MSLPFIESKLPDVGSTIFTVMSSLAIEHNSINLGQGFPDFEMNEELISLVNLYMKKGYNQYTHMNGLPSLRDIIAEKIELLYQNKLDPVKEITITPGGTYAIYNSLTAILNPGDEVIVFEPAYDSYVPNIEINGAKAVLLKLDYPDYKINWDLVKKSITEKTRLIIINSPNNPTGSILNKEDIINLQSIVKDTNILILSDEVYEHLIFYGNKHESILRYPDLFERSFVCFSFGKVYNCTGWKLGYCVAPEYLMKEFRKVHQFNCFSCNTPIQYALSDFLKKKENYLSLSSFIQKKKDFFQGMMLQTKFKPLTSYGSYFQLYSYKEISEINEKDFAVYLTKNYGVASIPVSAFYKNDVDDKVLRFCFAKKESTLETAANRLIKI